MTSHGLFAKPRLAVATTKSENSKIGTAAATYAAQASCPASCPFIDGGGCYAEGGMLGRMITAPLNKAAAGVSALEVARAEAAAIDALTPEPGQPMRLHTVGDCATEETARIVAQAAARYIERGGGPVWTYTHGWREVPREAWGLVSVLASCENVADIFWARQRGYATSVVVDEFPTDRRYELHDEAAYPCGPGTDGYIGPPLPHPGQDVVPCPSQTRDVHCTDCRLCFDDTKLRRRGLSIGFEVHGDQFVKKQARRALADPHDPTRRLTSRHHALALREELGRWPTKGELVERAAVAPASAGQMIARLKREEAA